MICCPWVYGVAPTVIPTLLVSDLGFWLTCGVKTISLYHGWGWQPSHTAPALTLVIYKLFNTLTAISVLAGAKPVLFVRNVLNFYVGIVQYILCETKNLARQNLLHETMHKLANINRITPIRILGGNKKLLLRSFPKVGIVRKVPWTTNTTSPPWWSCLPLLQHGIHGSARSYAGNLFQRGWPRVLWLG